MKLNELPYAQAFRDVIQEIVRTELNALRPTASLATVSTINTVAGTCNVFFPGDVVSVPVKMYAIQPTVGGGVGIGDVVQIEGESGRRYITRVVSGNTMVAAGKLSAISTPITGASSNLYIDAVTGLISRTTSSLKYKKLIEDVSPTDLAIMDMRVITYESNNENENKRYIGLIAEELAASANTTLHYLVSYDTEGNPDSVNYDRVSMIVVPAVQRIIQAVFNLNAKVKKNKDDLTAVISTVASQATSITQNTTDVNVLTGKVAKLEASLAIALNRITALEMRP